jgi:hypothetical protein
VSDIATFRCGPAARWLPRALAGAVLAAATLAAFRMDPQGVLLGSSYLRNGVALTGGLLALWIIRKGAEVRTVIGVSDEGLIISHGSRSHVLPFDRVVRLGYAAPFAATRNWLPAMLIWDKSKMRWRISSLLRDGELLLSALLEKEGREDLTSWSETLKLQQRMAASGRRVAVGYLIAAAILAAGLVYYFHE